MMITVGFDVGGVQPEIRPVAFYRSMQEGLNPLVDLTTEPRDLALADPLHTHGLDQLIHRTGRDALDVGFLDCCLANYQVGLAATRHIRFVSLSTQQPRPANVAHGCRELSDGVGSRLAGQDSSLDHSFVASGASIIT